MYYWGVRWLLLLQAGTLCGAAWTTYLSAHYFPQTRTFDDLYEGNNPLRINKYIYIKEATSETAPLVESRFNASSALEPCDVNAIKIYSGVDVASGLPLGSFCGGDDEEQFLAATTAMFVVIDVTKIPADFTLTVKYLTVKVCEARVVARPTPHFLYSPTYRGLSTGELNLMSCRWILEAPETHRIRVTLTLEPQYICPTNISLAERDSEYVYSGRVFATWCGQDYNSFISYHNNVQVNAYGSEGRPPPLKVEFRDIGADPCYQEIVVAEGEEGDIRSPQYPNAVSDLKVCRWKITTNTKSEGVLLLRMTDINLINSTNCNIDTVRVFDAAGHNSPVVKSWCGRELSTVDLYTSSLIVEYRTGISHTSQNTGFRLHYAYSRELLCSESLMADRVIWSPNLRSHKMCKWHMTSTAPELVVQMDLYTTNRNLFDDEDPVISARCDRLYVYDGLDEESPLLGWWCTHTTFIVRSRGQHLLVVYISKNHDLYPAQPFSMTFSSVQYTAEHDVSDDTTSLFFPNNVGTNYVAGYHAVWEFRARMFLHHIAIRFTDMDVYCPDDVVTISDWAPGSTMRNFSFCGQEDHSHFSSTSHVTISFTTKTNKGRGFRLSYELTDYRGCFRDVQDVNVMANESSLSTPGHTYYDNMDCMWRLKTHAPSHNVLLTIHAEDIVTSGGDNCSNDYLKVYDGYDALDGQLGHTICGTNKTWTLRSSTPYVFLHFISDGSETGRGFTVTFSSFHHGTYLEQDNTTAVVVGVVVSLILVIVICVVVFICYRRRNSYRRSLLTQPSRRLSIIQYTRHIGRRFPSRRRKPPQSASGSNGPPPAKLDLGHDNPGVSSTDDDPTPPSYNNAVSEGAIQFVTREPTQYI